MNHNKAGINATLMIRRVLFVLVVFSLSYLYLFLSFNGLSEPKAMEQAQIGREIARGNDFTTKFLRPIAIHQTVSSGVENVSFDQFRDTYHAPLNPIFLGAVIKLVGGDDFDKYKMSGDDMIYGLDRVIAASGVLLFLMSVGMTYLLVTRIFDTKIAGVTALLMVFCDLMWRFSLSGQPQMLMLLLFTCGLFFSYQALEKTTEGQLSLGSILLAGLFFCLMALTHWIAVWLVVGYAIFAALALRPRGVGALLVGLMLLVFSGYFIMKNMEWTGNPAGTAGLTVFGGLVGSEESLMRSLNPGDETYQILFELKSLFINITRNMLTQADTLYSNLGAILAAPMFFFALLHPFKRVSIARFRWLILLMWVCGLVGISIFGNGGSGALGANQINILFAPIMTAYGLAFASILWSRLDFPAAHNSGILRHGHFLIIIFISAGPLLLSLPSQLKNGLSQQGKRPSWPPYYPVISNVGLHEFTSESDIIVSDQPWAVAWYADRKSIWLPRKIDEFEDLEAMANEQNMAISGVFLTPSSFEHNLLYAPQSIENLEEFAPLLLDAASIAVTERGTKGIRYDAKKLSSFNARFPHTKPFFLGRMTYYSSKSLNDE